MRMPSSVIAQQTEEGEKKVMNSELWHACAGPLVSLPLVGSHVVYYPQGHSEQVAASTNKEIDGHIPNYSNLPPQLVCQLHDVTMHANIETDEVYAQMTLQPLTPQEQKDACLLPAELGTPSKQPTNYFCKTLTASDTSTHGGFSVPRRAAEKVFPPLDFTHQPPVQELIARDLHDNVWKFRHIFRGQPKRHLLTTGWSVFVSAKRLVAGDAVIFIWNENNQLFLGIRRAFRSQTVMPSSVLSSDSMHIGLLAAAAHAASTYSRFTIFYNPRASTCEFVVPLAKYVKAVYHSRVSVGMRFRMLFETEDSNVRRYMGTITGISDMDPVRWPNSHWRSVKVGWDESTAGERQPRVSLWEIEPLTTFPMYPSSFALRSKRPSPSSLPFFPGTDGDMGMNPSLTWLQREVGNGCMSSLNFQGYGLGLMPWNQPRVDSTLGLQPDIFQRMVEKRPNTSLLQFQQNNYQEQSPHFEKFNNEFSNQQRISKDTTSTMPPFGSSTPSQPTADLSPINGLLNLDSDSNPFVSSTFLLSKRVAVEPHVTGGGVNCLVPKLNELGGPQTRALELSLLSPPLTGTVRDLRAFQGIGDSPNNVLFGKNMRNCGNDNDDAMSLPFACSSFPSATRTDFTPSSNLTAASCLDESGFLRSSENVDQTNELSRTFVKVQKTGSFARSLDISKFSSYYELRSELARLFGLESELEDTLRSGWQLVFVDHENDILLLGDDPWREFVNNVWYITILSPQEVQQMGKEGDGLSATNSRPKLQDSVNGYTGTQKSRIYNNGIASVTSLDY